MTLVYKIVLLSVATSSLSVSAASASYLLDCSISMCSRISSPYQDRHNLLHSDTNSCVIRSSFSCIFKLNLIISEYVFRVIFMINFFVLGTIIMHSEYTTHVSSRISDHLCQFRSLQLTPYKVNVYYQNVIIIQLIIIYCTTQAQPRTKPVSVSPE